MYHTPIGTQPATQKRKCIACCRHNQTGGLTMSSPLTYQNESLSTQTICIYAYLELIWIAGFWHLSM